MAGPQGRPAPRMLVPRDSSQSAALRLLSAERPEEIFPILLEETVRRGYERALILEVNFETGEVRPTASLNCERGYLLKFRTSLWASENPFVSALQGVRPLILPAGPGGAPLYVYPMIYRSATRCWEAERERRQDCLAVQNFAAATRFEVQKQECSICGMQSYAAMLVAQVRPDASERTLGALRELAERANGYLSRLFKVEHYYNRMRDMETTITRFQAAMQSMPDPVILTDNQHRVIIQNKAAERFFRLREGVSEGGKRAVEFNNLLFSAALSSMAVSASNTSRDLTLVDVLEGEEVLFEAVSGPAYNKEGSRTGMVTVMRDVTDLRRADQEVRSNLEKLRDAEETVRLDRDRLNLVIENVGDPIIVADNAAKIVLLDPMAKELFGAMGDTRDPDTVRNQAKLDAYLNSFTFSYADRENRSLNLHSPVTRQIVEYAARSGKIYDSRGQTVFTVTVLRDFTAWKKLEQLQMERRMLEMEKFAATGRLAGTIAHEINNPLQAMKNAIYLLSDKVDQPMQPVFEILKAENERVTRIVRQMLGLYRDTAPLGSFDLNSVVEDTLTLFARPLEKAGIQVEKRLGDLPPLKGSADQFRQLLSNLVVNARDSMAAGGRLAVKTNEIRVREGTQAWVQLTVADTGAGIAPELRSSVFEPFVSTKGEKGTGLGLWIVKGVVENHNGRVRVRSTVGKGTVFKLLFPVIRVGALRPLK